MIFPLTAYSHPTVSTALQRGGRMALLLASAVCTCYAGDGVGADTPWTTHEAETMTTTGAILGPLYAPFQVETESSGQRCVRLTAAGEYVEFTAGAAANALVLRYSLPDSADGAGTASSLELLVNGRLVRTLALSSRYTHLYGAYPFSNQPEEGKPRNFYDECRVKGLTIVPGDVIRLRRPAADTAYCIVDLVDLEAVAAPLAAPENSLSLLDYGADATGAADATAALRACLAAALQQGKSVWVPAGEFKLTGDIILPSHAVIVGAGMWHTTFVGDEATYGQADRRVRFKLTGSGIRLSDFAIVGRLNYRVDSEPNDGVIGAGCSDSTVSRVWVEHTKCGAWIYNGTNLRIEGCRFRNLLADGINLCVGTAGTTVENCSARGTGDDCFAIWPAASDQGYVGPDVLPGNNVITRCTGQLPFLANGGAIYGGANNRIENCRFTDIVAGSGILVSTSFLTADEARGIDNNFSGTTVVRNNELVRCGGYDHTWAWRGAFQVCLERRSISGLRVSDLRIVDSISDGVSIVAPGSRNGQGTLSASRLERVTVANPGIGVAFHRGFWVRKDAVGSLTVGNSDLGDVQNDAEQFTVVRE